MTVRRPLPIASLVLAACLACGSSDGGTADPGPSTTDVALDAALPPGDVAIADALAADTDPADAVAPEDLPAVDSASADPGVADPGTPVIPAKCAALKEGGNAGFDVDGEKRMFILNLPPDAEAKGPWPVVFLWHGYGDMAVSFSSLLASNTKDASFPFILVTPEKSPEGLFLDWDMLTVYDAATNREARLFDEVLGCLEARYGVDEARIHTVGFSAGAVFSDLLAILRGDVLASVVTFSGGYLSNPANDTGFNVTWPPTTSKNAYTQVILSGGANDQWGMPGMMIKFEAMGDADTPMLNASGHDVIRCKHGKGHTVPSTFDAPQVLEFLKAHPLGTVDSPYAAGLPADYPSYCAFNAKAAQ